jgi:hypothetical protein
MYECTVCACVRKEHGTVRVHIITFKDRANEGCVFGDGMKDDLFLCALQLSYSSHSFFLANATTCPLWTSWSPLLVVAEVKPTSEVGTPMRRGYVVLMRWMVIYGYEVPGGGLNLSSTELPRPWSPWGSYPSRKNPHGGTGNWTQDLMISSQNL